MESHNIASIRHPVVDEDSMGLGHWLVSAL